MFQHKFTHREKFYARWGLWHLVIAVALGIALATALLILQSHKSRHRTDVAAQNAAISADAPDETPPAAGPVGGPFTLTDQDGKRVSDSDFAGKDLLIYFGYTACPDMCPTGLQSMTDAMKELQSDAAKVQPLFITVDPARDTPQKLKDYDKSYSPALVGLTGSADEIAAVARRYQVFYKRGEGDQDYEVEHSSLIYLVGPDRKLIRTFDEDADPAEIVEAVRGAGGKAD